MKLSATYRLLLILIGMLLMTASPLQADDKGDKDVLERLIQIPRSKETVYQLLGKVSERSGYLFIYDSKIIDNEQVVKIPGGKYTIKEAIYHIIGNRDLNLRVIGNHILISRPVEPLPVKEALQPALPDTVSYFTLEGILRDKYTNEPIPFATVSVSDDGSIGNVTNQGGEFRLRLPDSLRLSQINFSHVGYLPYAIESSLLAERYSMLTLEPKVIPIQEVVIRIVNPLRLLREMQEHKSLNYSQEPVYQTTFYREGIERKNKFVSLTEAVFKIYQKCVHQPSGHRPGQAVEDAPYHQQTGKRYDHRKNEVRNQCQHTAGYHEGCTRLPAAGKRCELSLCLCPFRHHGNRRPDGKRDLFRAA